MASAPIKAIRWDEDDPRDIRSVWNGFTLRVKAEQRGTVWVAYVDGPNFSFKSEHVSKDAAKQKAARTVREQTEAPSKPNG